MKVHPDSPAFVLHKSLRGQETVIRMLPIYRDGNYGGILVVLRDITGVIQITLKKGMTAPELIDLTNSLREEDVISVTGIVKPTKIAPRGREISPTGITVLSRIEGNLPLSVSGNIDPTSTPA
jgi:aspartyl/asparaginyl-tRNA synthetase